MKQYSASGTYIYVSNILTIDTTNSNFVCESPTVGISNFTVAALTSTTMTWDNIMTWTRSNGTDITGTWIMSDSSSGNSWDITFYSNSFFSLAGHIVNCVDKSVVSSKFPIATLTTKETGSGAAFDGTNYLIGIQGDSYFAQGISAQLVSQSGTLVGQRISLGTTCSPQPQQNCGGAPVVAFDGTNYLMVWEEDATDSTSVYGQIISKTGGMVGSIFTVGSGTNMQDLSLLFDGNNYFFAWKNRGNGPSGSDVYGQFVTISGQLLGSPIDIATVVYNQRHPVAAFDGTNILVAWVDGRNQIVCCSEEMDIYGQLIIKSTPIAAGSLLGGNFLINAGTLPRDNPIGIAFDGTNYLVTFSEETTFPGACPLSGCKWDVYGQLVTTAGSPTGSTITISKTTPSHYFSHPFFNGTNYLVTWIETAAGTLLTDSIKGNFFDTSGSPVGSEFIINSDVSGTFGFVAGFNNGKYLAVVNTGYVFAGDDIYVVFITP